MPPDQCEQLPQPPPQGGNLEDMFGGIGPALRQRGAFGRISINKWQEKVGILHSWKIIKYVFWKFMRTIQDYIIYILNFIYPIMSKIC